MANSNSCNLTKTGKKIKNKGFSKKDFYTYEVCNSKILQAYKVEHDKECSGSDVTNKKINCIDVVRKHHDSGKRSQIKTVSGGSFGQGKSRKH